MIIGSARISTCEQNLDLLVDALKQPSCNEIFSDTTSVVKENRLKFADAFRFLREEDPLFVYKLDRFGLSISNPTNNGAGRSFVCLSQTMNTTTLTRKLIFHIFGALAEFEFDVIRERCRAGMMTAKTRGRCGGKPYALNKKQAQ